MKEAKGLDVIDETLKKLADYTSYHFTTEEKYFDQFGYIESERHKEEHNYLLDRVTLPDLTAELEVKDVVK